MRWSLLPSVRLNQEDTLTSSSGAAVAALPVHEKHSQEWLELHNANIAFGLLRKQLQIQRTLL